MPGTRTPLQGLLHEQEHPDLPGTGEERYSPTQASGTQVACGHAYEATGSSDEVHDTVQSPLTKVRTLHVRVRMGKQCSSHAC